MSQFKLLHRRAMSDGVVSPDPKVPIDALPVDLDYITEELKVRAKTELFEDEKTKAQSLKLLRSMLKEEKNLRWQDDDLFLLAFLRSRKFDVKRAFTLIKGLYNSFGKNGDIYYNIDFDYLKRLMDVNTAYFLPYRNSESSVIIAVRFTGWDPEVSSAKEFLVCVSLGIFQALLSPSTQIAGFRLIVDFKDFTLSHLLNVGPSVAGFFIDIVQNTVPVRMCGLHVVYENPVCSKLWTIIKPLFSQKLRERFHFHGSDMKSLHKFFHPSILPADYEGELPPFNNADWQERMEASADYLMHVISFGYEKYLKKDWKKKSRESTESSP